MNCNYTSVQDCRDHADLGCYYCFSTDRCIEYSPCSLNPYICTNSMTSGVDFNSCHCWWMLWGTILLSVVSPLFYLLILWNRKKLLYCAEYFSISVSVVTLLFILLELCGGALLTLLMTHTALLLIIGGYFLYLFCSGGYTILCVYLSAAHRKVSEWCDRFQEYQAQRRMENMELLHSPL